MSRHASAIPVLMYHHVSPSPGLITVSPETFRAQMGWLARQGWHSIGCDAFAGFLRGDKLPDKSVLITFDDGYLDNWVHAAPILAEFALSATIFLITGWVGDGPSRSQAGAADTPLCPDHKTCMEQVAAGAADGVMLRWSEVKALRDAGIFEFHSHTHTHTRWDKSEFDPGMRLQRLGDDLAASRNMLADKLGRASEHLCWPQGYYDDDYRGTALALGFKYFYTVEKGVGSHRTDAQRIPRMVVKDRSDGWFGSRLSLYRHPLLAALYLRLRGR